MVLLKFVQRWAAALGLCFALSGCVVIPPAQSEIHDPEEQLVAHVAFLTQPALKGRKTKTRGARLARTYIAERFKSAGLVPWDQEKSYEQSFGFGINVIGVLPGTNPSLAKEFVLLSAHYDHNGKKRGKVYPGAADNASGVAVLLETVRKMSLNPPERPVVFAAFDAEERMMLGSFAYTCRKDVADAEFVGVVNVDMLGRNFLDVVTNAVFVAGTESYPDLREQVRGFGTDGRLRILPIGTDLVGPRSDHVAFENRGVPCLFFSCGTYADYHQPTDTIEKLDFTQIARSSEVIRRTVEALANGRRPVALVTNDFAAEELRTISTVLAEAADNAEAAGIRRQDVEKFRTLETRARTLLGEGNFNREHREHLAVEATCVLAPYLSLFEEPGDDSSEDQRQQLVRLARCLQSFYFNHRLEAMEGYRQLVARLILHRPGAFRTMPKFTHETCQISPRDIAFVETSPGRFKLNVLVTPLVITAEVKPSKWLVNSFSGMVGLSMIGIDGEGSREELADLCLITLREHQSNAVRFSELQKVYGLVSKTDVQGDFQTVLKNRLERDGFADEIQWLVSCIRSTNQGLACSALTVVNTPSDPRIQEAVAAVISDPGLRSDGRAAAIGLVNRSNRKALEALCDLLFDSELVSKPEFIWWLRPDYPFAESEFVKFMLSLARDGFFEIPNNKKTVGDLAHARLKKLSKRDIGRDAKMWRDWISTRF
jgi:hypothetical protein